MCLLGLSPVLASLTSLEDTLGRLAVYFLANMNSEL